MNDCNTQTKRDTDKAMAIGSGGLSICGAPGCFLIGALIFFAALNDGIMDPSPMGIEDERMMGHGLVKMWSDASQLRVVSCDY